MLTLNFFNNQYSRVTVHRVAAGPNPKMKMPKSRRAPALKGVDWINMNQCAYFKNFQYSSDSFRIFNYYYV